MEKTNVMRILDQKKVPFTPHCVEGNPTDGQTVARLLGADETAVFKTLVTESNTLAHYVFVIPVCATLDLKKAAKAAAVKSLAMLKQKDLLPLTGYVHGGCSPIGMKKPFPTYFDETACLFETVFFSAGKIGVQIEANPETIVTAFGYSYADLTV